MPTTFETEAPDAEEFARRIEAVQERHCWLVAEDEQCVVGYAYASRLRDRPGWDWAVELAVYVRPGSHRSGTGRALCESLIALLRRQGYVNVYSLISLPNAASVALHESLGFRYLCVLENAGHKSGSWRDVGWWILELGPHLPDPQRPKPLSEALSADEFRSLR